MRFEAPLLNARLRKSYLTKIDFQAFSIGFSLNYLTFPVLNLGNSIKLLLLLLEGRLYNISKLIIKDYYNLKYFNILNYNNLNIFIGSFFLERLDGNNLINSLLIFLKNLSLSYNNLHIISKDLGRLISSELGGFFVQSSYLLNLYDNKNLFIYLCGVDLDKFKFLKSTFIIFQGFFFTINY